MQIFSNFVFVFQEMDSIVDQMMTVAEYIGWETKELRPVKFYLFHSNMHSELKNCTINNLIMLITIHIFRSFKK